MADVSFAHVSAEGFTAFSTKLDNDAWGTIDVSTFFGADGRLDKPLATAPTFVLLKIQLVLAVRDVAVIMQSTSGAKGYDDAWDQAQKRFAGLIGVARLSPNAQERAAADRLHKSLLLGKNGDRQTKLAYQHEVDFGRKQIRLAAETQSAADLTLLGLGTIMANVASTTEDLAAAIGQGQTNLAPSLQRKASIAECVHVFGTVYRTLAWLADYGDPADRERALELQSTLEDLAARYPAKESKPKTSAKTPPVVEASGP